jgi:hypothetical protein
MRPYSKLTRYPKKVLSAAQGICFCCSEGLTRFFFAGVYPERSEGAPQDDRLSEFFNTLLKRRVRRKKDLRLIPAGCKWRRQKPNRLLLFK